MRCLLIVKAVIDFRENNLELSDFADSLSIYNTDDDYYKSVAVWLGVMFKEDKNLPIFLCLDNESYIVL